MVLESVAHARRRGARHVNAQLSGWGHHSDATHLTTPEPGKARALSSAWPQGFSRATWAIATRTARPHASATCVEP